MKPSLRVNGMHGLGDNLHQRGVVRSLAARHEVWLDTPWPALYHDMPDVHLFATGSRLRTQSKSLVRERVRIGHPARRFDRQLKVASPPAYIRQHRSVARAMAAFCGVELADWRLPVPDSWTHGLDLPADRPVMVYRPLTVRREWTGAVTRNPDAGHYAELYQRIRDRFYVISVADIAPPQEMIDGPEQDADLKLHAGQLGITQLAALWKAADLVFTSPGMGLVMAQAVGTPYIATFGGYESAYSFSAGESYARHLNIEPINPCDCCSHTHACDKRIDMPAALARLDAFTEAL